MNSENDWDVIWRRQKPPEGKSADIKALLDSFEMQRRRQARTLWVRDIGEFSASVLVATVFGAIALKSQKEAWLIWPAVALVLAVGFVFLRERFRTRKTKAETGVSMLEKLASDMAELRHQEKLLGKVALWYLLPIAISMLLVLSAMILKATRTNKLVLEEPLVRGFLVGYLLLCLGLFVGVWWMNRRAVKKRIQPRLEELEKLRQHILSQRAEV